MSNGVAVARVARTRMGQHRDAFEHRPLHCMIWLKYIVDRERLSEQTRAMADDDDDLHICVNSFEHMLCIRKVRIYSIQTQAYNSYTDRNRVASLYKWAVLAVIRTMNMLNNVLPHI